LGVRFVAKRFSAVCNALKRATTILPRQQNPLNLVTLPAAQERGRNRDLVAMVGELCPSAVCEGQGSPCVNLPTPG